MRVSPALGYFQIIPWLLVPRKAKIDSDLPGLPHVYPPPHFPSPNCYSSLWVFRRFAEVYRWPYSATRFEPICDVTLCIVNGIRKRLELSSVRWKPEYSRCPLIIDIHTSVGVQ